MEVLLVEIYPLKNETFPLDPFIARGHPLSTNAKISEKLAFLTP